MQGDTLGRFADQRHIDAAASQNLTLRQLQKFLA